MGTAHGVLTGGSVGVVHAFWTATMPPRDGGKDNDTIKMYCTALIQATTVFPWWEQPGPGTRTRTEDYWNYKKTSILYTLQQITASTVRRAFGLKRFSMRTNGRMHSLRWVA